MKENENSSEKVTSTTQNQTAPKRKFSGLLIVFILFIAFMVFNKSEPVKTIDCTPEIIAKKPDIIMLGAWWCTYCYQAKKYFQQNEIHYCEYDMENTTTGQQLYRENGGGAVPILLIGEYRLQGFSETQIEKALTLLKNSPDNSK